MVRSVNESAAVYGLVLLFVLLHPLASVQAIQAEPTSGNAPLEVYIDATDEAPAEYSWWTMDFNSDGVDDASGEGWATATAYFDYAGTYYPSVAFYDADYNVIHTTWVEVVVYEAVQETYMLNDSALFQPQEELTIDSTAFQLAELQATLTATPDSGTAPLSVWLQAVGVDASQFYAWTIDADGDGNNDLEGTGTAEASHTYEYPGVYYPAVHFYDYEGGLLGQAWSEVTVTEPQEAALQELDPYAAIGGTSGSVEWPSFADVTLTATPNEGYPTLMVRFDAYGIDINDYAYWELDYNGDYFADGGDKGVVVWTVAFDTPGTYYPQVWFYDSAGNLLAQASTAVTILDPYMQEAAAEELAALDDRGMLDSGLQQNDTGVRTIIPAAPVLLADPISGAAPLEVKFSTSGIQAADFSLWQVDVDGDGWADGSGMGLPEFSYRFESPGSYYATVYFYDNYESLLYSASVSIEVGDGQQAGDFSGAGAEIAQPLDEWIMNPAENTLESAGGESGEPDVDIQASQDADVHAPGIIAPDVGVGNALGQSESGAGIMMPDEGMEARVDLEPGMVLYPYQLEVRADQTSGPAPFECQLSLANAPKAFWVWELDFEPDGELDRSGQGQPGSITGYFMQPGTYHPTFVFYGDNSNEIAKGSIEITVTGSAQPPEDSQAAVDITKMWITANPEKGHLPLKVLFSALEIEPPEYFAWVLKPFGRADIAQYPGGRPVTYYTYESAGTYAPVIEFLDENYNVIRWGEAVVEVQPWSSDEQPKPAAMPLMADLTAKVWGGMGPWNVEWSAEGSTPRNNIVEIAWDKDGNGGFETVTTDKWGWVEEYDRAGRVSMGVRVKDASGQTDTHTASVLLGGLDAELVGDTTYGPAPLTVHLDASGSTSEFGGMRYRWDVWGNTGRLDKEDDYAMEETSEPYWQHTLNAPGKYTFCVSIDGGQLPHSLQSRAYWNVEVLPSSAGDKPVAEITLSKLVNSPGEAVEFNGLGSRDPDGSIVNYFWDYDTSDSNPAVPDTAGFFKHTYEQEGIYTASLQVMDNDAFTSEIVELQVEIRKSQGQLQPVAKLTATPVSGAAPLKVTFDASTSIARSGSITEYQLWPNLSDVTVIRVVSSPQIAYTYEKAGTYTAELIVKDAERWSEPVQIKVEVAPNPNPAWEPGGRVVTECSVSTLQGPAPLMVNFDASASHTETEVGTIDKYQITAWMFDNDVNDGKRATSLISPFWGFTYNDPGVYIAEINTKDQNERLGTPLRFTITVLGAGGANNPPAPAPPADPGNQAPAPGANQPPVISCSCSPRTGPAPLKVAFDASQSTDADGKVALVHFQADGNDQRDKGESFAALNWTMTYQVEGSYIAEVYVVDDQGAQSQVLRFNIEVIPEAVGQPPLPQPPPPPAPQAQPSANQPPVLNCTYTPTGGWPPLRVDFDASASSDADGQVTQVYFDADNSDLHPGTVISGLKWHASYTKSGEYYAEIYVIDDRGGRSQPQYFLVSVHELSGQGQQAPPDSQPGREPPLLSFSCDVTQGPAPLTVRFDIAGSTDADGKIEQIFFAPDRKTTPQFQALRSTTWQKTYDSPGEYTAACYVIDNDGNQSLVREITVKVSPPQGGQSPNTKPVALYTVAPMTGAAPLKVDFDASQSYDPDGRIVAYYFDYDTADTAPSRQIAGGSWSMTYYSAGRYTVGVYVEDDRGEFSEIVTWTVLVTDAPQ